VNGAEAHSLTLSASFGPVEYNANKIRYALVTLTLSKFLKQSKLIGLESYINLFFSPSKFHF
jgi:hypothetical protein